MYQPAAGAALAAELKKGGVEPPLGVDTFGIPTVNVITAAAMIRTTTR